MKVTQSCPTLCDPIDYTVHGILQVRILEWVAFPFSRGSSQLRDQTQVSHTAGGFFTSQATGEAKNQIMMPGEVCLERGKRGLTPWGDDHVLYLDKDLGYTGVCMCPDWGFLYFSVCKVYLKKKKWTINMNFNLVCTLKHLGLNCTNVWNLLWTHQEIRWIDRGTDRINTYIW